MMEQNTRREYSDVTENLRRLRGLSEDDVSEEGLLRSRIEQQSELICILKQRADEYLKKYMEIEKRTENVRNEIAESLSRYEAEKKDHEILKNRFNTLDHNHVEMIKLKDEYKNENAKLRKENMKLKQDNENMFSETIREKDRILEELSVDVIRFKKSLEEADEKERDLKAQLDQMKEQNEKQLIEIKTTQDDEKSNSKETFRRLEEKYSAAQKQLTSLQRQLDESDQQKTGLQDLLEAQQLVIKENEIKFNELQRLLEAENEKVRHLDQRLKKESESLSTNQTIRRLKVEINEAKQSNIQLHKEFDAYKKHTSNLLNRERDLNVKLRRLNIP
ncbi:coiled-coil domain-containing protein 89-like [Rhopilema esculentum]|uniref:coiled-coil domain-containing protein 89-like n=1 Tax=Rhopilema esculentum TaxID=499914 RepID=UPI0031D7C043